ncbi:MAG TPA: flagellar assembly protein FliW [Candidatus Sulfotelmatobacter sp.]|nr:flagellar assembly protein FliW [Candidatus Sulfotelmatobacter sp.]
MDTTQIETTTMELPRFGSCTFREDEVLTFPWGLPGFGHLRRFLALHLEEQEHFIWLQSLDDPSVALPTCNPFHMFPDYQVKLPEYAVSSLDLKRPEEFVFLGIVIVGPNASDMTMNLLAPVIVNLRTRTGRQVTLEGSGYSVRTPVPRKAPAPAQASTTATAGA